MHFRRSHNSRAIDSRAIKEGPLTGDWPDPSGPWVHGLGRLRAELQTNIRCALEYINGRKNTWTGLNER
jgi:hypothetical protein